MLVGVITGADGSSFLDDAEVLEPAAAVAILAERRAMMASDDALANRAAVWRSIYSIPSWCCLSGQW